MADRLQQAAVVEPVDPFEGRVFDGLERAPRTLAPYHFCFVEPVDRFGQGVVVAIADAADRRYEAGLAETLRVLDRDVLHAAIRVVDETAADRPAFLQGLLQRIEHEAGMRRARRAPADDPAGVSVDDEGHVDEACPGCDVGEVRHPQRVRPRCAELAIDVVEWTGGGFVADGGAHRLAADDAS